MIYYATVSTVKTHITILQTAIQHKTTGWWQREIEREHTIVEQVVTQMIPRNCFYCKNPHHITKDCNSAQNNRMTTERDRKRTYDCRASRYPCGSRRSPLLRSGSACSWKAGRGRPLVDCGRWMVEPVGRRTLRLDLYEADLQTHGGE